MPQHSGSSMTLKTAAGRYAAELICLQEMESTHLAGLLTTLGPEGSFDHSYMRRVGQDKHDGCAVIWAAARWKLLEAVHVRP